MSTVQHITTADELLRMSEQGARFELIRGELREMSPAGSQHGRFAINVSTPLDNHVKANGLGVVYAAETGFRVATDPDTVLAADVAFVTQERFEALGDSPSYFAGPPDLAAEVISPNDSYAAVDEKIAEWLEGGTRMLLLINPRRKTVIVFRSLESRRVLTVEDTIDGEDVVPGWKLPVAQIF